MTCRLETEALTLSQVAWLRAVLGSCSLHAGNRARAVEMARLSGAAFRAQPTVSAYYKEPHLRLERELANNKR